MPTERTTGDNYHLYRNDVAHMKKNLGKAIPKDGVIPSKKRAPISLLIDAAMEEREERGKGPLDRATQVLYGITRALDVADFQNNLSSVERFMMATAKPDKIYYAEHKDPEKIIVPWFIKSAVPVIVMNGFMGAGKTDMALLIYQIMEPYGFQLLSNVPNAPGEKLKYVEDIEDKLLEMKEERKLLIYDEAGRGGGARKSGSAINVTMNDVVTQARKTGTAVIYITQLERQQDVIIRELANVIVTKKNPKKLEIEEYLTEKVHRYEVLNWPATDVYFGSYAISDLLTKKAAQKNNNKSKENIN